jgi:hypothetical protein
MLAGQCRTIGTIMIIFFLQGMLDGQHGTIGMIVHVLVVEVTVYVIETVVIQHGTILVAIVTVRTVKTINGKDATHKRVSVRKVLCKSVNCC